MSMDVERNRKKGKEMAAEDLKTIESEEPAKEIINRIKKTLGVSFTMLAAKLEVSERTLRYWQDLNRGQLEDGPKSSRLTTLEVVIIEAIECGVPQENVYALLDEPIDPNDEESPSLMYYIIDDPNSDLLKRVMKIVIPNLKDVIKK